MVSSALSVQALQQWPRTSSATVWQIKSAGSAISSLEETDLGGLLC